MSPRYKLPTNGETCSVSSKDGSAGCFVSLVHGFILLLLAMVLTVGVGVAVYFATGRELVCQCGGVVPPESTISPGDLKQMCIDFIQEGTGEEICEVCPAKPEVTDLPSTTPAVTIPPTTEEPRDYRLPITVIPYLYTLELNPNIYGNDPDFFNFTGSVKIESYSTVPAKTIVLHAHKDLNILKSSIKVINMNTSSEETVNAVSYEELHQFYTLHLAHEMSAGDHYSIQMEFNGPLKNTGTGLYLSSYEEAGEKIYLVTTQFEATYARGAFPCFDEPALKAQFDITLVRREHGRRNYTTLSNAPKLSSTQDGSGLIKDKYERTVVMPTYLLAFIVCDYEYTEDIINNITYRTWAWSQKVQFTETAQRHGLKIFQRFAEYFTPEYVFSKLDNIVIPDFASGAMENWGLITYRDTLLYEPGVSTSSGEDWITEVISHEIAHQWFGNLVSPKWWTWLWLNEGFASFWDTHIVGEIYPSWRTLDTTVVRAVHSVMTSDSRRTSRPLTVDVMTPTEIDSMFNSITYSKGSAVVKMMHLAMGQDMFIKGLNRYLASNQFGNADNQDLWAALNEESQINGLDLNMTEIMDPWVTQINYPVVKVSIDRVKGQITLTQERFLLDHSDNTSDDTAAYEWTIPITYTTSDRPNFTTEYIYSNIHYMMHYQHSIVLDVDVPQNGWIIVNLQQYGFYRVLYEEDNWNNIFNFLVNDSSEVIHPINRAQIINDAWNLAKAELLPQRIALQSIASLSRDLDYVPWRAFIRELDYVEGMLQTTLIFGMFQDFIHKSVEKPFVELGSNMTEDMPPIEKAEKSQIVHLACHYDYKPCVDEAVSRFQDWFHNVSDNRMHPDLRLTYYCTSVRNGGVAEWMFVYHQYHTVDSSSERNRLREALSCTREPWLLQRLLDMSIDPDEVRSQDTRTTVEYVAKNRWGKELAWNFLTHNFDALVDRIELSFVMSRLVLDVTSTYNTEQQYKMVEDFMNSRDVSSAGTAFIQVLERTRTNIEWVRDNYEEFEDWLQAETRLM